MKTIDFKLPKLVRNKIPDIIRADGKECDIEILSDEDYIKALDAKLDEELAEYHESHSLEELADLFTVICFTVTARGHSLGEFLETIIKKNIERGEFNDRILLKRIYDVSDEKGEN